MCDMGKVVVTAQLPGAVDEILQMHEIVLPTETQFSRQELIEVLGDADGLLSLLSVPVDAALLAAAPRLRVVANYAVGYDNIDVAACAERGIVVTHTPDVLTAATAELTWALILGVARRVEEGIALMRQASWQGWQPTELCGRELDGATLGIVGLGRIGQAVARRARAFGMQVVYANPRAVAGVDGARLVSLDELLKYSDVVSLHCPLNQATRALFGVREFAQMKPTAIFINTARGAIVDESALADALERGHLFGAGLDVYASEPQVDERLRVSKRALLLPHLGSATEKTRTQMARLAAESIVCVLSGGQPQNEVPAPSRNLR